MRAVKENEALEAAYRATRYEVGKLALRVGEPHPWLDHILDNRGLDHYAYLTAWNPRSRPTPREANERAMRALAAALDGWQYLRGVAVPDDDSWAPEPSYLVMGIGEADALDLARRFEQNAILVGERGGVPRLAWTE